MVAYYTRPTTVICPKCKIQFNEDKVESLDIEEDMMGYDVLTFKCPICEKAVKSKRRG